MRQLPRSTRLLTLAFVLAVAAPLAGCSSQPAVLARIGDHSITTEDFLEAARQNRARYPGSVDSARAALLEDLVQRQLLVTAARLRGLVPEPELKRLQREAMEQAALRALVQRLAPSDPPVSDAEVRALYDLRGNEVHTLVVFTPDPSACRQALAEIRGGADFGAVADRFNTTGMTPRHGDLGFITPGTLLPALDDVISRGALGKVHGPLESPGDGWFLVKLIERRARRQEPLEQVREALRQGLQRGKQRVLFNRLQQELMAQYHVGIEPGAAQALFTRVNAPRDTILVGGVRMGVPAAPTPDEARQALLRYDGEDGRPVAFTLGDAVQELQDPTRPAPNFSVLPMIDQWLKAVALQRVATVEVHRRHLNEEPAIARRARAQVENTLLQAAYHELVVGAVTATEADVRAAFERHAAELVDKDGAPLAYDRLEPGVRQALEGEAVELLRELRLRQVTDSLRLRLRPEIHRERLARVPWPPAGTATGG